ncbi:MAG: bacteriohemerythrin [Proteobacteria bacterium]|nr:bacteriohemerythrin [Pseudomonadota bacterium]MBU1611549.1 bacteriohemerythrin [Pseudomonadota bacterium]
MAFIEFGPENVVGVAIIDEQHHKLFDMLNTLHQATVTGEEQSALVSIFDDLIEYTVYHFRTEEEFYVKHEYPSYEAHKAEHDKLAGQAVELLQQFQSGSATISFDLLDFLHGWLLTHTMGLDKEVGPFLNDRGVF